MRPTHSPSGFTLLELSIVLLVLAIIVSSVLSVKSQDTRTAKLTQLNDKLAAIQTALMNFGVKNKRLPCPGDATTVITSQYFGKESSPTGDCTNGQTYASGNRTTNTVPPAVNFYDGTDTVGGMLPVRTLGLPDDMAFDPWGGRFLYFASKLGTSTNASTTYTVSDATVGKITVYDGSAYPASNARTSRAAYVIVSAGLNGHGAYQISGSRKATGSTNSDELLNCHCDASATATAFDAHFAMHPETSSSSDPLNNFDDKVVYQTWAQYYTSLSP